jgi:hypothetical protein
MQIELLSRQKWRTKMELALALAEYIEHFYNSDRRHSALGYFTPNEFEDLHSTNHHPAGHLVRRSGPLNGVHPSSGDDGTRTHDPLLAKQVL